MVTWNQKTESVHVSRYLFITTKEVGQYHQPVLVTLHTLYFPTQSLLLFSVYMISLTGLVSSSSSSTVDKIKFQYLLSDCRKLHSTCV